MLFDDEEDLNGCAFVVRRGIKLVIKTLQVLADLNEIVRRRKRNVILRIAIKRSTAEKATVNFCTSIVKVCSNKRA
jgi:diaminopimelate decarboxylase